jgi:hypothetical protein
VWTRRRACERHHRHLWDGSRARRTRHKVHADRPEQERLFRCSMCRRQPSSAGMMREIAHPCPWLETSHSSRDSSRLAMRARACRLSLNGSPAATSTRPSSICARVVSSRASLGRGSDASLMADPRCLLCGYLSYPCGQSRRSGGNQASCASVSLLLFCHILKTHLTHIHTSVDSGHAEQFLVCAGLHHAARHTLPPAPPPSPNLQNPPASCDPSPPFISNVTKECRGPLWNTTTDGLT